MVIRGDEAHIYDFLQDIIAPPGITDRLWEYDISDINVIASEGCDKAYCH
jgi:hypothetical protein